MRVFSSVASLCLADGWQPEKIGAAIDAILAEAPKAPKAQKVWGT